MEGSLLAFCTSVVFSSFTADMVGMRRVPDAAYASFWVPAGTSWEEAVCREVLES